MSMFSSIDELSSNSEIKKITDSLIISLSELDVKVLDENITGNNATVTVKAKGLSLYVTLNEVYDSLKTEEFLEKFDAMKEDELKTYFTSLLLESINNSKIEERTVNLNLTKVNKKWQIDPKDDTLLEILWGINEKKFS